MYSNEGNLTNGSVAEGQAKVAMDEMIRVKEQAILDLGSLLSRSGRGQELAGLISGVRPFLSLVSKAKAAKLVRQLVDLLLDMDPPAPGDQTAGTAAIGIEVKESLVRDCITWAEQVSLLSPVFMSLIQTHANLHTTSHQTGEADVPEAVTGSTSDCPAV